jgi:hypothetical protein
MKRPLRTRGRQGRPARASHFGCLPLRRLRPSPNGRISETTHRVTRTTRRGHRASRARVGSVERQTSTGVAQAPVLACRQLHASRRGRSLFVAAPALALGHRRVARASRYTSVLSQIWAGEKRHLVQLLGPGVPGGLGHHAQSQPADVLKLGACAGHGHVDRRLQPVVGEGGRWSRSVSGVPSSSGN